MNFSQYKYLILSDLYRITGAVSFSVLLRYIFLGEAFKYTFWMRTCGFLRVHPILKYVGYPIAKIILNHFTYKLGICIPVTTKIGSGFYIGHFGGIVINGGCVIGKNCNISHGVTIGQANRGANKGYAVIGDDVYIGPGAKIIGAVKVGNNAAIGANCVVTKDVPANAVVVGIPGKVVSTKGSAGYVNRTDYEEWLGRKLGPGVADHAV